MTSIVRKIYAVCLVVFATVCVLTACSVGEQSENADLSSIKAVNLNGREISLAGYKGDVLLVNFWATWCPPCKEELPDFNLLQRKYESRGFRIVGISVDEGTVEEVIEFCREEGVIYEILYAGDRAEQLSDAMGGVRGIPTTFVVDRAGKVVKKVVGVIPLNEWSKVIDALI